MLLSVFTITLFAIHGLARPPPGPRKSCSDDPAYAGFTQLEGITSFCQNALPRPTTTVTVQFTDTYYTQIYVSTTITVTRPQYKSTSIVYTTPTPTSNTCAPTLAALAQAGADARAGGFITGTSVVSSATTPPARLAARDPPCPARPKVTDQILSACSCFFTQEHTQTADITRTTTVTSSYVATVTVTSTKTSSVDKVRTRTLAVGCEPSNAVLYHAITYAACGSPGLGVLDFEECDYPHPPVNAFEFDGADCCTACANTLNCFQGYSSAVDGQCRLSYRTGNVQYNATVLTPDCPAGQSVAVFSDPVQPTENEAGFVRGHCAQSC